MRVFVSTILILLLFNPVVFTWDFNYNMGHEEISKAYQSHTKKTYAPEEAAVRKTILFENIDYVKSHNAKYEAGEVSHTVGLNKFSDMTKDEFSQVLGYKDSSSSSTSLATTFLGFVFYVIQTAAGSIKTTTCPKVIDDGTTVDLRFTPCWGKVLDQGQCGSCYAFSAVQVLDYLYCFQCGGSFPRYSSEQNIVDCSSAQGNQGCNGGMMSYVYDYIKQAPGINTNDSYPYTAKEGTCKFDASTAEYKGITGYTKVPPCETEMMKLVKANYTLTVAIKVADKFQSYSGGVYATGCVTFQNQLNHAVVIEGYGTDPKGGPYWIVKNSWGLNWGDKGYIYIKRGNNCLGIAYMCGYPTFECDKV